MHIWHCWCYPRAREGGGPREGPEPGPPGCAAKAGLGSGTDLRQHMRIALRTTPSAYRRAFRSTTVTHRPRSARSGS
ncbi:hypothetical protein CGL27_05755 [Streptomyces sp. 11-1-2]|nr:hypothetical protein CGL27_05755 [Streptomyces sp. 11-1-2]